MSIILNQFGNPPPSSITLHTRKGTDIPNVQDWHLSVSSASNNARLVADKRWSKVRWRTTGGSGVYNCHGLTFAARRTNLIDLRWIERILHDDSFEEIHRKDILSGDVVLYFSPEGEPEHSGIISSVREGDGQGMFQEVWVFSKWGSASEAVHLIHDCPYNASNLKFFSVMK